MGGGSVVATADQEWSRRIDLHMESAREHALPPATMAPSSAWHPANRQVGTPGMPNMPSTRVVGQARGRLAPGSGPGTQRHRTRCRAAAIGGELLALRVVTALRFLWRRPLTGGGRRCRCYRRRARQRAEHHHICDLTSPDALFIKNPTGLPCYCLRFRRNGVETG